MSSSPSSSAPAYSEQAKLFVGGLPATAASEALADYFRRYGGVVEAVVLRDSATGFARGFGFVEFTDTAAAGKALEEEKHVFMGKTVEVKRAIPRKDQHHNRQHQYTNQNQPPNGGVSNSGAMGSDGNHSGSKKIFVGGLPATITEDEFREYFEKFGTITDVVVMYDSITNRPRGFGFITFDSERAVDDVLKSNFHKLNDKAVEVKIAVPKNGYSNSNGGNHGGNFHNSRTGGRRDSLYNGYHGRYSPSYSPNYGGFNGYMPLAFSGYNYDMGSYIGGYPFGAYAGLGYGAPFVSQRYLWDNQRMVSPRHHPMPYGNTVTYPNYTNPGFGGYGTMATGGHYGIGGTGSGSSDHDAADMPIAVASVDDTAPSQIERKVDAQ